MDTQTSASALEFRQVSLTLGGVRVLDDLTLAVPAQGITVILGPSGSGKSTLTRLTNRLVDPDTGEVRLHGTPLTELPVLEVRRRVGMVFQRPAVFPGTVADNLAETGVDASEFPQALSEVGLSAALLDQEADTLSGGQAQRMCLARALLLRPEILIADEPTASLDPNATAQLEDLFRRISASGVPIVCVSHDHRQFDRIADHGVLIEDGRLVRAGPADDFDPAGGAT